MALLPSGNQEMFFRNTSRDKIEDSKRQRIVSEGGLPP